MNPMLPECYQLLWGAVRHWLHRESYLPFDEISFMNSQIIVPVAIIVLMGIVLALIFINRKDEKEVEE